MNQEAERIYKSANFIGFIGCRLDAEGAGSGRGRES